MLLISSILVISYFQLNNYLQLKISLKVSGIIHVIFLWSMQKEPVVQFTNFFIIRSIKQFIIGNIYIVESDLRSRFDVLSFFSLMKGTIHCIMIIFGPCKEFLIDFRDIFQLEKITLMKNILDFDRLLRFLDWIDAHDILAE